MFPDSFWVSSSGGPICRPRLWRIGDGAVSSGKRVERVLSIIVYYCRVGERRDCLLS
jgi:hypothetical protein